MIEAAAVMAAEAVEMASVLMVKMVVVLTEKTAAAVTAMIEAAAVMAAEAVETASVLTVKMAAAVMTLKGNSGA
jgi:hypothetical protein